MNIHHIHGIMLSSTAMFPEELITLTELGAKKKTREGTSNFR